MEYNREERAAKTYGEYGCGGYPSAYGPYGPYGPYSPYAAGWGPFYPACGEFEPPRFRLGVANVPMQQFYRLYCPDKALMRGTLFAELYMPFSGDVVEV